MFTGKINSHINDRITSRELNDFPELKCRYQIFHWIFPYLLDSCESALWKIESQRKATEVVKRFLSFPVFA
jgi:hypothetical protein